MMSQKIDDKFMTILSVFQRIEKLFKGGHSETEKLLKSCWDVVY